MVSKIKLICSTTKKVVEHNIDHAQNLMDYQKEKGFNDWSIAKDEPYKLKDGIIVPTDKGENRKTVTPNGNTAGNSK